MRAEELRLDQLLLDPNNYRLQDGVGFQQTAEDRFHLEPVQRTTLNRLRSTGLKELRDSIVSNGFLNIERIVVTPYAAEEGKYVVIEGNRRVAALMQIRDEIGGGVPIPQEVVQILDGVPCIVADGVGEDRFFREKLMGSPCGRNQAMGRLSARQTNRRPEGRA